jgi:hypothetical protein
MTTAPLEKVCAAETVIPKEGISSSTIAITSKSETALFFFIKPILLSDYSGEDQDSLGPTI